MSLRQAVEIVTETMMVEAGRYKEQGEDLTAAMLHKYAVWLQSVLVVATELAKQEAGRSVPLTRVPAVGEQTAPVSYQDAIHEVTEFPPALTNTALLWAGGPAQQGKRWEEEYPQGFDFAVCVAGGSMGDRVPVPANTPRDGSYRTTLGGEVYVLKEDGRLHFSASETVKQLGIGPK